MDPTQTKEYFTGYEWAGTNVNRLRELYTGKEIATAELRSLLFSESMRFYPSHPGDMENEFKQTLWVTGALKFVVDKIEISRDALTAVFEAAMEMGAALSAEYWKLECFKDLKGRPDKWWRKKIGDATPDDVVAALAVAWRRNERRYREKGRENPLSRWEVLVDRTGSREMCVLSEVRNIELVKDGRYWYYRVEAKENSFEVIMRPAYDNGIMTQGTGEIIG